MKVIGLTGSKDNKLMKFADVCIRVPELETYKIQELHLPVNLKPNIASGRIFAYDIPEYIKDMGTPDRYYEVEEDIMIVIILILE